MNRMLIIQAVAKIVVPVMLALGFIKTQVRVETPKVEEVQAIKAQANSMRTYYRLADGTTLSRKPEGFTGTTIRASSISQARSQKVIG
jgi:anti-sigma-K factor RskA